MTAFTAKLDTREQERWLRRYTEFNVDATLTKAALAGAKASVAVLRARAPIGTSKREGQYYRRNGLKHGTFRDSIKAAKIKRGGVSFSGQKTIGYVTGPIGPNGFTRAWREYGTYQSAGTHWTERAAPGALADAERASLAVLDDYTRPDT